MRLRSTLTKGVVVAAAIATATTAVCVGATESTGVQSIYSGPQIWGLQTVYIYVGDDFDRMAGVTAVDGYGNDITDKVRSFGAVDLFEAGHYSLLYTVTDDEGHQFSAERIVVVQERPVSEDGPKITGTEETLYIPVGYKLNRWYAEDRVEYKDVQAIDKDGNDVTDSLEIDTHFDIKDPGRYTVIYRAMDKDKLVGETIRTVVVYQEDFDPSRTEPKLSGVEDISIDTHSKFDPYEGVGATDDVDGDISDYINVEGDVNTNVPGTYSINYSITNTNGQTEEAQRTVTVENSRAPQITGLTPLQVRLNGFFSPFSGVDAFDYHGNSIRSNIQVEGIFDTSKPGNIVLTYRVHDNEGNKTEAKRTITVLPV